MNRMKEEIRDLFTGGDYDYCVSIVEPDEFSYGCFVLEADGAAFDDSDYKIFLERGERDVFETLQEWVDENGRPAQIKPVNPIDTESMHGETRIAYRFAVGMPISPIFDERVGVTL